MTGEDNEIEALRRHGRLVTAERDSLDAIALTISRTLDDLEDGRSLPDEGFFRVLQEGQAQFANLIESDHSQRAIVSVDDQDLPA